MQERRYNPGAYEPAGKHAFFIPLPDSSCTSRRVLEAGPHGPLRPDALGMLRLPGGACPRQLRASSGVTQRLGHQVPVVERVAGPRPHGGLNRLVKTIAIAAVQATIPCSTQVNFHQFSRIVRAGSPLSPA